MRRDYGKPYYITTAIAYISGKPHIGNTCEATLTNSIACHKKEQGYDVFFQTGTDEHGQKIELETKKMGITPQGFVDGVTSQIQGVQDMMNTSHDKSIRTTDKGHETQVQKMFKKLYDRGDIYKEYYEGLYCTPYKAFLTESQLVDGRYPGCGREVQPAREETCFFKVGKYADRLIQHINRHPEFIRLASRRNEMISNFLLPGLQDLCVSRASFTWGVPVSFDPKHATCVWLDVLTNYITDIGCDCDGSSTEQSEKLWPADLHLIGGDIIRFHTTHRPIFLMALDLPLPKQVFGHPWLLQGDGKMSKPKGNILYAGTLVDFFSTDAIRYFVLREVPFDNDSVISRELMVGGMNSDLANVLGDLVNRTISTSNKYFGGIMTNSEVSDTVDKDLKAVVLEAAEKTDDKMEKLHVADTISEIFNILRRSNKYIDETMPWVLAKDEVQRSCLKTALYDLTEAIAIGTSLPESFTSDTSTRILAQLNTEKRSLEKMETSSLYPPGNRVAERPEILFTRMDLKEVMGKVEAVQATQRAETGEAESGEAASEDVIDIETKPEIEYEDFAELQFQVGEIIVCEEVPKSKKFLCSQVRVDSQVKQIVNGIRAHYSAKEMVGKKVMVVINLKPAKLTGVLSEGMLLCTENADGNLSPMTPGRPMLTGAETC